MTDCDLETSFIFEKTVEITSHAGPAEGVSKAGTGNGDGRRTPDRGPWGPRSGGPRSVGLR